MGELINNLNKIIMKEIRVYFADVTPEGILMSDDEFMDIAELQGSVFSLKGFAEAFNNGTLTAFSGEMRFIEVDNFN